MFSVARFNSCNNKGLLTERKVCTVKYGTEFFNTKLARSVLLKPKSFIYSKGLPRDVKKLFIMWLIDPHAKKVVFLNNKIHPKFAPIEISLSGIPVRIQKIRSGPGFNGPLINQSKWKILKSHIIIINKTSCQFLSYRSFR